ncbi:helix-turn-helix domain-containing protein [Parerythrobacter jejuensis]|uniref:Helix-turn-helix domain-containing protein n=1 Tax=Parerythrobacter jejuensis TaxID=795812 RepID=A0A845AR52_9SPHN|nr:helix-turn-helix domain-containing protein [Parerythrobacter jejuensis]MXP30986.1 helix-turn-helix domain-containing protein [Parerythrobacter jejuensis]MXP33746.1 helix-turn-helix domain-containing protein [Parerythrobacter jejuensis]
MKRVAEAGGAALKLLHGEEGQLVPPSIVSIDYFDPPGDLRPYVTTLFHFCCDDDEIRDIQPADLGKLMLVLKGTGMAHFRDGRSEAIPTFSLQSPTSVALPFHFVNGFHSLGAALTPLGWAALSKLSADEHGNMLFDAAAILGEESNAFRQKITDDYGFAAFDQDTMIDALAQFIRGNLKMVAPRHIQLIQTVVDWLGTSLDPSLDDLYAQTTYSTRQSQRLVERYFGLTPRALKRKYRAVRAAAILTAPDVDDDSVTAVEEHFYDQSHLIREIGLFVGRTPSRLGGDDNPILNELLDLRNFRIKGPGESQFDPSI